MHRIALDWPHDHPFRMSLSAARAVMAAPRRAAGFCLRFGLKTDVYPKQPIRIRRALSTPAARADIHGPRPGSASRQSRTKTNQPFVVENKPRRPQRQIGRVLAGESRGGRRLAP